MEIQRTPLPDLIIITPKVHTDDRGFFMEVYRRDVWHELGLDPVFVQTNHSSSTKDVLRGLHLQWDQPLTKLIRVIRGAAYFVSIDLRRYTSTFGQWFGCELSAENRQMLFVPSGFASGFCVTGDVAEVEYQYTAHYNPSGEASLRWNDPDLNIRWPVTSPIVSPRDEAGLTFASWKERPESQLFVPSQ